MEGSRSSWRDVTSGVDGGYCNGRPWPYGKYVNRTVPDSTEPCNIALAMKTQDVQNSDNYMSEFGVSTRGEPIHPHVSARQEHVVVGGLWREKKNRRVTLLHGTNDVPLEDRISAACKHFQTVYRQINRQITAESHSLPTSNTYGGEDKENKSTKSTLLGLSELFWVLPHALVT